MLVYRRLLPEVELATNLRATVCLNSCQNSKCQSAIKSELLGVATSVIQLARLAVVTAGVCSRSSIGE
jgi:hypothetical protein